MAQDAINICNQALVLVGCDEMNSFDDETQESRVSNLIYETIKNSYLESYTWRFATGQEQLALLVDEPLFDWSYAFQMPPDLLRLQKINSPALDYQIYQDKLYCNTTEVYVEGLYDVGEINYPAYFVMPLVYKLSSLYATSLLESDEIAEKYEKKFTLENRLARSIDAMQHPPKRMGLHAFQLVAVRA